MTGFGRAEGIFEGKKISVDLKSLNSKSFDLNIKILYEKIINKHLIQMFLKNHRASNSNL